MSHQTRGPGPAITILWPRCVNYHRRFLVITNLSRLSLYRWRTQLYRCVYQGGISGPGKVGIFEMGQPIGTRGMPFFPLQ
jgi:hypothetical protein